jgi:hypothetical protein
MTMMMMIGMSGGQEIKNDVRRLADGLRTSFSRNLSWGASDMNCDISLTCDAQ